MTGYTAITKKRLRGESGSLSYKLATEYGLLETLLDGVDRAATTYTFTKATITLTATTALNLDGKYCQFAGASGATGRITPAAASTTMIGGGTAADSLILQGSSANATEKITILGGTSVTVLGTAVVLDGSVTVDGDHTFGTGTGAVSLNGSVALASGKTYTSGTGTAIGGTHIIYGDGAGAKSLEVIPGTKVDLTETNINLTGLIKLDGTVTLDDDGQITDVSNVTTITQGTIKLVGSTAVTATTGTLNVQPASAGNAIINLKADTLAHLTITQTNGAGVTFLSTSDGTAGFLFDGGIITLDKGATLDNTAAADALTIEEATLTMDAGTLFSVESGDIRLGYDDGAYMKIAVTDETGVTAVTFAGSGATYTLTAATMTFTGATKINLDGPTDVTGILTIDTASSPADGILINAATPTDGLEIASACGTHAINISAAQSGAGITIGSTCGTYGLNLAGACTTAGINIAAQTTTGIMIAGAAAYNPIVIGTKSSTEQVGLTMTGVLDNTSGVMIFTDDGDAQLGSSWITSPIWTRYMVFHDQTSVTPTGAYLQLKAKEIGGDSIITFTTCDVSATKVYLELDSAMTLASGSCSIINAGVTMNGAVTDTAEAFSGIDVNINDGTDALSTAKKSAGIRIRKTSGSTAGWPIGLMIDNVGATKGIHLGNSGGDPSVSGILMGIGTTGTPATTAATDANFIELRCETTATSGDDRLLYMRYYMNGVNATGGECLKAGTVLEKAIGTARGGQASIEVSSTGYVSGFAAGWDALLEVADSAVPSGTYCGGQSQIWMTGSSSDLSATTYSLHRFSVAGGDATAESGVKNAFSFAVPNCAGSGAGNMISLGTSMGTVTGTIRILINGAVRYIPFYSAEGHS